MCSIAQADEFGILTPYVGTITNQLKIAQIEENLEDTALLSGLFYQRIDPQRHQWNLFLYGSREVNESRVLGSHGLYDHYFAQDHAGHFVAGLGFEYLRIETDAPELSTLVDFEMTNHIMAPFARIGRYLNASHGNLQASVLLWGGYEQDIVRGDLAFTVPAFAPGMPVQQLSVNIDDETDFGLVGANLQIRYHHFCELKLKYRQKIDLQRDESYDVFSAMANLMVSRQFGFSYRFKHMEESSSENDYHLFGLAWRH